ncbi:putative anti-sigma-YlaC factor YlaD [Actinoplanes teichomyceticus]|uniref:Putative anti-sigma-YlaC factor YlaD n=2 Tax=Actinoplanes teichomyceticus TaxID=1867 RepID=A0A561WRY5_ACTTI|nr:putative anti-sigma-YlaC factor YlaD [Actinoplanes teichomyceticus]
MLSAQLDGEDDPVVRPLVDEHLAGCAGCREWLERAAAVNRLTRTGAVPEVPDLSAAILAARPAAPVKAPSRRLPVAAMYVALALIGAVQIILGLAQVGGASGAGHVHLGPATAPGHLWNESAAWNVAVGAGYLVIALRRTRPVGLVPMLTAFVGMLLLLSVNDLTAGRVDVARLVGHGFVVVGYLLVVALSRSAGGSARPPGVRVGAGWRFDGTAEQQGETPAARRPGLRLVPPTGPLTARRDCGRDRRRAA